MASARNSTLHENGEADNHRKQPDQQKRGSLNWVLQNENLKQRQIYGQRDDRPQLFLEAYAAIRHKERKRLSRRNVDFSGLKDFSPVGSGFGVRRLLISEWRILYLATNEPISSQVPTVTIERRTMPYRYIVNTF